MFTVSDNDDSGAEEGKKTIGDDDKDGGNNRDDSCVIHPQAIDPHKGVQVDNIIYHLIFISLACEKRRQQTKSTSKCYELKNGRTF